MAALHVMNEHELAPFFADPATPDMVRALIQELLHSEPVNAAVALEVLAAAMSARANRLLGLAPN